MVLILSLVVWAIFLDAKQRLYYCQAPSPKGSGFLVLTGVDSGPKIVKAALLIPTFKKSTDKLVVATAATGAGTLSYDPIIVSEPDVTDDISSKYINAQLPYSSSSFWYPFDSPKVELVIDFKRNFKRGESGTDVPLRVEVDNKVSGLILESCVTDSSAANTGSGITTNRFSLTLHRHRFIQFIAGIFLIVALAFLVYIAFKEEKNKVLSSSLGYIAALWGIRQILVGSERIFPTIVDFVTLALYIVVAIIVFHKLFFGLTKSTEV